MGSRDIFLHSKELPGNKRTGRPSRFLPRSTSTTVRSENKRVRAGFWGRGGPWSSCAAGSGSRTSTSRPHLLRRQIFIIINTLSTPPVKGQQEWSGGHCEETWMVMMLTKNPLSEKFKWPSSSLKTTDNPPPQHHNPLFRSSMEPECLPNVCTAGTFYDSVNTKKSKKNVILKYSRRLALKLR